MSQLFVGCSRLRHKAAALSSQQLPPPPFNFASASVLSPVDSFVDLERKSCGDQQMARSERSPSSSSLKISQSLPVTHPIQ